MEITGIGQAITVPGGTGVQRAGTAAHPFSQALGKALGELNTLETDANNIAGRLAAGDPVDLHEAVLALEKANIGFQLALQVRNKLVEAYQDVMRMQV